VIISEEKLAGIKEEIKLSVADVNKKAEKIKDISYTKRWYVL